MTENRSDEDRRSTRERTVLRLYNDGWRCADFDVVFELVDPGIVWTAIEDAPDAGTYRGHDGVRTYMQDWLDDFEMGGWQIEESIEVGDWLVCVQHAQTIGKGSGVADRHRLHVRLPLWS